MRVVSVVGARPQFIKLGVIATAIKRRPEVEHVIIHTGQHYDDEMSAVFFRDLDIPLEDYNLAVGSGSHGVQTAEMLRKLEPLLDDLRPDWTVLYGDTNSTVAGALAAAKLRLPIAHIEAGLRCFDRKMAEEANRLVADHLSDILFCPTRDAYDNLAREGLAERAVFSGDVMYDAMLTKLNHLERRPNRYGRFCDAGNYALVTIHRAENVDDLSRLCALLSAIEEIANRFCPVILTLHPRTRNALGTMGWQSSNVTLLPPLPYPEMLQLERQARFIMTDSGGVQREAYFLRVPCITLRNTTEWLGTLENGCNIVAGSDNTGRIVACVEQLSKAGPWTDYFGDGQAGDLIIEALCGVIKSPRLSQVPGTAEVPGRVANRS